MNQAVVSLVDTDLLECMWLPVATRWVEHAGFHLRDDRTNSFQLVATRELGIARCSSRSIGPYRRAPQRSGQFSGFRPIFPKSRLPRR